MLDKLAKLLTRPAEKAPDPLRRALAMGVLLVETARADFDEHGAERELIVELLRRHFALGHDEAHDLVERAFATAADSVSLHKYLQTLNAELDLAAKSELLLWLWRVAYADGRLDPYEEARIRQLADLLFVPHAEFVRRRLQVETEMGLHS